MIQYNYATHVQLTFNNKMYMYRLIFNIMLTIAIIVNFFFLPGR